MATRMLIDARHPEETRVAVLKGNRIEEFDFESADRKQIKGNIYLAKVTRVEPSLQAAFVDFGGNRHGFLAFSEIHPDYYQIPKEDRAALLAEEAAHAEEEAALRAAEDDGVGGPDADFDSEGESDGNDEEGSEENDDTLADDLAGDEGVEEIDTSEKDDVATIEDGQLDSAAAEDDENSSDSETTPDDAQPNDTSARGRRGRRRQGRGQSKQADELRAKRMALRRRYKIQDVIQRRQVLLVQVVKEERGNKGAALTSYLSLAGRYCVLMPNSSHGGGISRKISSASDRKRLKQIVSELNLPKSMGCIVRTAGLQRTKTEIKRDFDYLARLWDEIREGTLGSSAPALIHSDSDLIKRAIRDIYNREIEEVVVEGDNGYKAARQFMKLLMPSHARRIKAYADPVPLFQRYGAEDQLSAMYDPVVQLKSGGYLVINPTEALVSIDINSGRSTKEHGIEQTALATNLEAAREIARQLRLRDMAGLVVIDFIDMERGSNVRKVEKTMKDSLKTDRARIQVGRISGFGLMEMSRQRLRTGVLEATTRECPHCDGTGLVRTAPSAGLSALRLIEDEAAKGKGSLISLYASTEAAIYMLNAKRSDLAEIETRYAVSVEVVPEGENEGAKMRVASSGVRATSVPKFEAIVDDDDDDDDLEVEDEAEFEASGDDDNDGPKKRRRRRRGGRGRKRSDEQQGAGNEGEANQSDGPELESSNDQNADQPGSDESDEDAPRKKRRRRGGRGRRRSADGGQPVSAETETEAEQGEPAAPSEDSADQVPAVADADNTPETVSTEEVSAELPKAKADEAAPAEKPKRTRRARKTPASEAKAETADKANTNAEATDTAEAKPKPKRTRRKKAEPVAEAASGDTAAPAGETGSASEAPPVAEADPKPKRTRRKKADEKKAPATKAAEDPKAPEKTDVDLPPPSADMAAPAASAPETTNDTNNEPDENSGPARRGWWQRTFGN